ncbi:carboxypeptidase-like regulatory domain-containing protein [Longitalea arenae]|uniref:carboxypeptidase-like regulatory domain-containing protein n=1 Tax=Longitalea arenae TaxID=2812558 RepID=UPI001967127A|nr:carboxypeptidase-like regulatory domain-containing protein [Longitalea arenae]
MGLPNRPIICFAILLLPAQPIHAQIREKASRSISGKLINQLGEPVQDVTVANLRTGVSTITNKKGLFHFKILQPNTFLKVYGTNIKTDSFFVRRVHNIIISVQETITKNVVVPPTPQNTFSPANLYLNCTQLAGSWCATAQGLL